MNERQRNQVVLVLIAVVALYFINPSIFGVTQAVGLNCDGDNAKLPECVNQTKPPTQPTSQGGTTTPQGSGQQNKVPSGQIIDPSGRLKLASSGEGGTCLSQGREQVRPSSWWGRLKKTVGDHPYVSALFVVGLIVLTIPLVPALSGIFATFASIGGFVASAPAIKAIMVIGGLLTAGFSGGYLMSTTTSTYAKDLNLYQNQRVFCTEECSTGLCMVDDALNADGSVNKQSVESNGKCVSLQNSADAIYKAGNIGKGSTLRFLPDGSCCTYNDLNNNGVYEDNEQSNCFDNQGTVVINNIKETISIQNQTIICQSGNTGAIAKLFHTSGCNSNEECKNGGVCVPNDACKDSGFLASLPLIGAAFSHPISDEYYGLCTPKDDICIEHPVLCNVIMTTGLTPNMLYALIALGFGIITIVTIILIRKKQINDKPSQIFNLGRRKR